MRHLKLLVVQNLYLDIERVICDTLEQLMDIYDSTVCTEQRDRVYGIRALASNISEQDLRPDYPKSAADLHWGVMSLCDYNQHGNTFFLLLYFWALELSVYDLLWNFEARLESKHCRAFLAQNFGSIFAMEETVLVPNASRQETETREQLRNTLNSTL
jgi:hypothetical protein